LPRSDDVKGIFIFTGNNSSFLIVHFPCASAIPKRNDQITLGSKHFSYEGMTNALLDVPKAVFANSSTVLSGFAMFIVSHVLSSYL
jgi:hypothetical protein